MEVAGHGRPPRHVAGEGHVLCLFPGLAVSQLAPAHGFAAGGLHAGSMKICFHDEIVGSQAQGDVGVDGPHPWAKRALAEQLLKRFQTAGENLQLDWDALGDEHSNLFHIYYGQQFD